MDELTFHRPVEKNAKICNRVNDRKFNHVLSVRDSTYPGVQRISSTELDVILDAGLAAGSRDFSTMDL